MSTTGCSWFQKSFYGCLLLKLLICLPNLKTYKNCVHSFVDSVFCSDLRDLNIFHAIFVLNSQSMMLSSLFFEKVINY